MSKQIEEESDVVTILVSRKNYGGKVGQTYAAKFPSDCHSIRTVYFPDASCTVEEKEDEVAITCPLWWAAKHELIDWVVE